MFRVFLTVLFVGALSNTSVSAPDDRGQRGTYLALSGSLATGTADDDRGRSAGSHLGHSYHLRFGEEVFDRLTLGMMLTGGTARANQDLYDVFWWTARGSKLAIHVRRPLVAAHRDGPGRGKHRFSRRGRIHRYCGRCNTRHRDAVRFPLASEFGRPMDALTMPQSPILAIEW